MYVPYHVFGALLGILWDSWSEAKTALTQWFGLKDCVYPLSNQHT